MNYKRNARLPAVKIKAVLAAYGVSVPKAVSAIRGTPAYLRDRSAFLREFKEQDWVMGRSYPCLTDRTVEVEASGHYFHQDLLVAQRIYARNPRRHIDVGSRVDGFVAHVATFRTIEEIDIRPMTSEVANIKFVQMDLMNPLPASWVGACDSLSCLHVLEHFGLGRYGDPIDPNGYRTGFSNIARLLSNDGTFYFSVPIGLPQRVEFNAHRVFSVRHLLDLFAANSFDVVEFSYVRDDGTLAAKVPLTNDLIDTSCGARYGCGIFELRRSPKTAFS